MSYKSLIKKIHELEYEVSPHPPYSPDISPTDYDMFRRFVLFEEKRNLNFIKIKFVNSKKYVFFLYIMT